MSRSACGEAAKRGWDSGEGSRCAVRSSPSGLGQRFSRHTEAWRVAGDEGGEGRCGSVQQRGERRVSVQPAWSGQAGRRRGSGAVRAEGAERGCRSEFRSGGAVAGDEGGEARGIPGKGHEERFRVPSGHGPDSDRPARWPGTRRPGSVWRMRHRGGRPVSARWAGQRTERRRGEGGIRGKGRDARFGVRCRASVSVSGPHSDAAAEQSPGRGQRGSVWMGTASERAAGVGSGGRSAHAGGDEETGRFGRKVGGGRFRGSARVSIGGSGPGSETAARSPGTAKVGVGRCSVEGSGGCRSGWPVRRTRGAARKPGDSGARWRSAVRCFGRSVRWVGQRGEVARRGWDSGEGWRCSVGFLRRASVGVPVRTPTRRRGRRGRRRSVWIGGATRRAAAVGSRGRSTDGETAREPGGSGGESESGSEFRSGFGGVSVGLGRGSGQGFAFGAGSGRARAPVRSERAATRWRRQ